MSRSTAFKSIIGGATFFGAANVSLGAASAAVGYTAANSVEIETLSASEVMRVSALGDLTFGVLLGMILGAGTYIWADTSVVSRYTRDLAIEKKKQVMLLIAVAQLLSGFVGVAMHRSIDDSREVELGDVLAIRSFGCALLLSVLGCISCSIAQARHHQQADPAPVINEEDIDPHAEEMVHIEL